MIIIYEDDKIRVELNSSNEVFVSNKHAGVTARITDTFEGFTVTAHSCRLEPWSVNGLPAIRISSKGL